MLSGWVSTGKRSRRRITGREIVIELARRTSLTLATLVVATVFGCALIHVLAMLLVYATLLVQGNPMQVNPAILARAMWVGAMQGVAALPVAIVLGFALHVLMLRIGMTRLVYYVCAALFVTVVALLVDMLSFGVSTVVTFWIMGAASGVLAGCIFWLVRRPDRDAVSAPPQA